MVMAKSSYCYQVLAINTDKYADLRTKMKGTFEESSSRYGSRRIHSVIKSAGATISEKVIRRIMKEEDLIVPNIKRKKYSSYKGEITPAVENIINRDFKADKPNNKWLTDITEFHIPAGKIYLSPIIDCFDGLPVSWTIGTSPNAELVNIMLDEAIFSLEKTKNPSFILILVVTIVGQAGLNVLKKLSLQGQCQRKAARQIIQHVKDFLAD
jgi:Transposase and inactivated derivatives